jgi:hypothetical protein
MKQTRHPVRLLAKTLFIAALALAGVMSAMPVIASGLAGPSQMLLSAALLLLLAGPTLYWRCMAVPATAPAATRGKRAPSGTVGSAVAMTALAQALGLVLSGACMAWQQHSMSVRPEAPKKSATLTAASVDDLKFARVRSPTKA